MATSSSRTRSSGPVLRSLSPSGRFCSSTTSNSSFASSTSAFASSFSSPSSSFFHHDLHHQSNLHQSHYQYHHHHHDNHDLHHNHHHHQQRSASPTRVNLYTSPSLSPAVRFSIDHRSISPNRNQVLKSHQTRAIPAPKKTCMCSPTSHPGSFRCSLHKNSGHDNGSHHNAPFSQNRLNMRRSAMKNSLVRIGGVEGEWVKRALTALIRPSSHQLRRRANFEPTPSRLCVMSKADDL
ncbi:hypothetical protein RGQ29_010364 [Quercus rubra]|uniref:Serine-rich protein-like protein n=1 Tax=Quercus rubra TaxID=3512 RepID=A0AAN7G2Z6_QUERU|nr:hypothetical protein RGQ29_010364 [Quercus rubra]KAK4600680.1 hypothetical protein RGQ29_010364 [Quercus rubra]KAK4600681.1 hypothetical protein RGQ29_010364 [Quercus rubra]